MVEKIQKFQLTLIIHGRVQDVDYRYFAEVNARALGLFGFVRNDIEGTVTVVAEGEKEKLQKFKMSCAEGPPYAEVWRIEEDWKEIEKLNFSKFEIIR